MHSTTLFTALLAIVSLAASSPIQARNTTTTYSIGLTITTSAGLNWRDPTTVPVTATLDQLTLLNAGQALSASSIAFSNSTSTPTLDINSVQCRAYKDAAGVQPGSAPFNATEPALLSTNLVDVSSVLCYVVTADE